MCYACVKTIDGTRKMAWLQEENFDPAELMVLVIEFERGRATTKVIGVKRVGPDTDRTYQYALMMKTGVIDLIDGSEVQRLWKDLLFTFLFQRIEFPFEKRLKNSSAYPEANKATGKIENAGVMFYSDMEDNPPTILGV